MSLVNQKIYTVLQKSVSMSAVIKNIHIVILGPAVEKGFGEMCEILEVLCKRRTVRLQAALQRDLCNKELEKHLGFNVTSDLMAGARERREKSYKRIISLTKDAVESIFSKCVFLKFAIQLLSLQTSHFLRDGPVY